MKIFSLIGMLFLSFLLTACDPIVVDSKSMQTYTIVGVKSPKHFRVDLKDSNGNVIKSVAVSKHCNRWREVKVGTSVSLMTYQKHQGDRKWTSIEASSICPR